MLMKLAWSILNDEGDIPEFMRKKVEGQSLQQILNLSSTHLKGCTTTLNLIIHGDEWQILDELQFLLEEHGVNLHALAKSNSAADDERVWTPDLKGTFTVKSSFVEISTSTCHHGWSRVVWRRFIHPQLSTIAWKLIHKCTATQESVKRKGVQIAS
ncbi:hypothetical protein IFM89_035208 [Coptis chinensis]|uniref:Reverse transcriptase zinc-binding domain-containing protein n=1 Tax=Coptis chinensis TaxID=261450 RepID=A0A835IHH7_9MAGN|nr:hypothetical protein IFM89_035208 [Coptis chinensis]